ncbi:MAG TPA: biotin--[acetyl-CoA-carboxylase] ligase [Stellaceae bacterium]|nr:biotin--[acetyl-CoA-carboxylase] ligase [Stellaceae bacterium]
MTLPALADPFRLVAYETVGSTNDEAKRLARDGAAEGLVVWAREQQAGRGRRGHVWASPPGNLYLSLLLRPNCRAAAAAQLGFVTALALAEALGEFAGTAIDLRFKWPNDVMGNGRKLAGILLETEMLAGDVPAFVVIGIGVNLASSPREVAYPATSLIEEGVTLSPETLIPPLAERMAAWLETWRTSGFAAVREAWLGRAIGLGGPIRVRLEHATLDGAFLDLDEDGALLLGLPEGRRRIAAGEIFPARAA